MRSFLRRLDVELSLAFVALFVALGATSYAAIAITGREIQDGTVTGADVGTRSLARDEFGAAHKRLSDAARPGPVGPVGPAGAVGPAGPVGESGARGPTGERGERGPAGDRGAPGPAGPQGAACVPEIASCRGPQGARGAVGEPGVDQGSQGVRGIQGPTGLMGPRGETGPDGATGPPGPQGERGEPGPDGVSPRAWTASERRAPFYPSSYTEYYWSVVSMEPVTTGSHRYFITYNGIVTSSSGGYAICMLYGEQQELARQIVRDLDEGSLVMLQGRYDGSDSPPYTHISVRCVGSGASTARYYATSTLTAVEIAN